MRFSRVGFLGLLLKTCVSYMSQTGIPTHSRHHHRSAQGRVVANRMSRDERWNQCAATTQVDGPVFTFSY